MVVLATKNEEKIKFIQAILWRKKYTYIHASSYTIRWPRHFNIYKFKVLQKCSENLYIFYLSPKSTNKRIPKLTNSLPAELE